MNIEKTGTKQSMSGEVVEKEVLFQKIGSQWYVFSFDGDQLNFCALPSHLNPKSSKVEIYEEIAKQQTNQAA